MLQGNQFEVEQSQPRVQALKASSRHSNWFILSMPSELHRCQEKLKHDYAERRKNPILLSCKWRGRTGVISRLTSKRQAAWLQKSWELLVGTLSFVIAGEARQSDVRRPSWNAFDPGSWNPKSLAAVR